MKFSLTFLKNKMKKNSVLSSPVHPHSDWRMLTISFFVVCVVVVLWSFYLFWTSENNVAVDPFRSDTPSTAAKTPLQRIDEFFLEREKFDPSL
jgi:membrane associated rhomboid family serine protease